ncbi:hypothetical protein LCGC14_0380530 [marine sediment metagenome]|uniref:Uncharacterized protein n=1 Tax=marine sediment metagenome TaxID=412755 RepID=A0A0F9TKM3_9ZZZZ
MEKADEDQILAADKALKQAMVYSLSVGGKDVKQITYIGLKFLTLKMSQAGQPLEVFDEKVELVKHDDTDTSTWIWYASIKVRNQKTKHESVGISEAPYMAKTKDGTGYDQFGRTKALSKAERNAWRKQIPELEIMSLLKVVEAKDVKELHKGEKFACKCVKPNCDKNSRTCNTCGGQDTRA